MTIRDASYWRFAQSTMGSYLPAPKNHPTQTSAQPVKTPGRTSSQTVNEPTDPLHEEKQQAQILQSLADALREEYLRESLWPPDEDNGKESIDWSEEQDDEELEEMSGPMEPQTQSDPYLLSVQQSRKIMLLQMLQRSSSLSDEAQRLAAWMGSGGDSLLEMTS